VPPDTASNVAGGLCDPFLVQPNVGKVRNSGWGFR
jgi:hypothetical protein